MQKLKEIFIKVNVPVKNNQTKRRKTMNLSPDLLRDLSQALYSFGDGFFRLGDVAIGLAEGQEEVEENTPEDCNCETCMTTSECCWETEEENPEDVNDEWYDNEDDDEEYDDFEEQESGEEEYSNDDEEYLEDVEAEFDEDWEV